jgi:hypothetical protein
MVPSVPRSAKGIETRLTTSSRDDDERLTDSHESNGRKQSKTEAHRQACITQPSGGLGIRSREPSSAITARSRLVGVEIRLEDTLDPLPDLLQMGQ